MAGRGSRTSDVYKVPKPLIPLHGHPLFSWATAGLPLSLATNIIFVTNRITAECADLVNLMRKYVQGATDVRIVVLDELTSGQAETVYIGTKDLDPDESLLIFNCDTLISNDFPSDYGKWDGILGTFRSSNPGMSYVLTQNDVVIRTVEKQVISEQASTGLYYFRTIDSFRSAYLATNHVKESYVAPLYNHLIKEGLLVSSFATQAVIPLGTSDEIKWFESLSFPVVNPLKAN